MIAELVKRGYDSDPVKAWKVTQQQALDEEAAVSGVRSPSPASEVSVGGRGGAFDGGTGAVGDRIQPRSQARPVSYRAGSLVC